MRVGDRVACHVDTGHRAPFWWDCPRVMRHVYRPSMARRAPHCHAPDAPDCLRRFAGLDVGTVEVVDSDERWHICRRDDGSVFSVKAQWLTRLVRLRTLS